MTTTYTRFTPSATATPPFQFTAELDDVDYTIYVTWNVYGQNWYITAYNSDGVRVRTEPLIASPDTGDIHLLPGILTSSTLIFRDSSNNFEVTT